MGVFFKSWGLDGSLAVDNFGSYQSNGQAASPTSLGITATGDSHSSRVSIDGGTALLMSVLPEDAVTAFGHRTELLPATTTGGTTVDYVGIADWGGAYSTKERWYRVQFKIPKFDTSFLADVNTWLVVTQLHQSPDTNPADVNASPPISIHVTKDGIEIKNIATAATISTSNNTTTRILYKDTLTFDTWYDFTINVKWSWTSLGKITIWKNRKKVYEDIGAMNSPNNDVSRGSIGTYAKFGIYTKYPMTDYTKQVLKIYHRGIIVGDETTQFKDMFPEVTNAFEIPPDILTSALIPKIG